MCHANIIMIMISPTMWSWREKDITRGSWLYWVIVAACGVDACDCCKAHRKVIANLSYTISTCKQRFNMYLMLCIIPCLWFCSLCSCHFQHFWGGGMSWRALSQLGLRQHLVVWTPCNAQMLWRLRARHVLQNSDSIQIPLQYIEAWPRTSQQPLPSRDVATE